jgi:hypothetical protein
MSRWVKEALAALRTEQAVPSSHPRRRPQLILFLSLATVLPVVFLLSTHIWLRSAYTRDLFHMQSFALQYSSSIYRYRILGPHLVLSLYHLLARHYSDQPFSMPMDPQATLLFYGACVLLNGISFFFSNLLLLLFLWDWKTGISDLHLAHYFYLILLLALSTCVVTPYDQIAYLLMLMCFLSVRIPIGWLMYVILGIAAIAGGLNRETEFLVTPALWTIALFTTPTESRLYFRAGLYHLVLFGACYVGLRIFMPGAPAIAAGMTLGGKWAFPSLIALSALFYVAVCLATRERPGIKPSIILVVLSAPYILTILIGGELRELRLLLPLLLCLFFVYVQLAHLKPKPLSFTSTSM